MAVSYRGDSGGTVKNFKGFFYDVSAGGEVWPPVPAVTFPLRKSCAGEMRSGLSRRKLEICLSLRRQRVKESRVRTGRANRSSTDLVIVAAILAAVS
jgi:hypothetical protein